jgi:DNA (cytosine-5)-methyltransferase 1
MKPLTELSLFTGGGGGVWASKLLGHKVVGYVEIEDYPQRIIKARIGDGSFDNAPIFGDIKTFISEGYADSYKGMVDIVSGGFPCQDISVAGNGEGITGERSGLWKEYANIVRVVRPRKGIFVENSPALTHRGMGTVLWDLASMGYDARWGVFSAGEFGFEHERKRIFIYAYPHKNHDSGNRISTNQRIRKRVLRKNGQDWQQRINELAALDVISLCNSYPEGRRVFYGMAGWGDRLASLGNGQVPRVAATAFRILSEGLI